MDDHILQVIRSELKNISIPNASSKVYKEESMFSFDNRFSPSGIFINLKSWQAYGKQFLELDHKKTKNKLYLLLKSKKVKKNDVQNDENAAKPTKLGIGIEGGFISATDEEEVTDSFLYIYPEDIEIALPCNELPEMVSLVINAIMAHEGVEKQHATESWQEDLKESKYSNDLLQLKSNIKISPNPSCWSCVACQAKENLWLNLSDGYIGCGRRNWDGSGGCGESLNHFEATGGKYPLCVKLGTITSEGGDVFSYAPDENDMVLDKNLEKHLSHWGINASKMKKSDKTMNELQIDLNMSFDLNQITEEGTNLVPIHGKEYVGMINIGNTCYLNSIMQLLFSIKEVKERYTQNALHIFETCPTNGAANDFNTQMCKLANGLLSDIHESIAPKSFKWLVGKDHKEYSSFRQQDAMEFLIHLFDLITKAEKANSHQLLESQDSISNLFQYKVEDRIQCLESNKVKYIPRTERYLQLEIPLEAIINSKELEEYEDREKKRIRLYPNHIKEEHVRPIVPFEACIERFRVPETITDFYSTATRKKGSATKQVFFRTFPRYLLVQFRRYYVAEDWTPNKLDVTVPVPEKISLESMRGNGLQDGEEVLIEPTEVDNLGSENNINKAVVPDEALVSQLMAMGFSQNGCQRAAIATTNGAPDTALEWIFAHMEDSDFNDPPVLNTINNFDSFNPETIQLLMSMGFTSEQAEYALKSTSGDPDRAAEWLFSHSHELETISENVTRNTLNEKVEKEENEEKEEKDKYSSGDYTLVGFVSHIGKNTNCGHYVCHLKKEGQWIIFNDSKVAVSMNPPFGLGYIYLFIRDDLL